jgi:signal transduction histidine kinase
MSGLFFTYLATTYLRRLRQEKWRAEALLQEVLANREAQVRAAALDERARLAREMHDVLAHTLSALSVQLEGARMLVEQRSPDPEVVGAVDRASRLAREGLVEARRAVGSLRGETLPGPDLLPRLAEDFERDSGVPCRLRLEGQPADLSAEARLALYRTAQEALTNIRKHANPSCVEIVLRYTAEGTELTVEDRASAQKRPDSPRLGGGGYGLNGMRERAALLNGKLEAGATPTGFRVRLWIPREAVSP